MRLVEVSLAVKHLHGAGRYSAVSRRSLLLWTTVMQQDRGAETPNVALRVFRELCQALESAGRGEESCPEIHVSLSTVPETF